MDSFCLSMIARKGNKMNKQKLIIIGTILLVMVGIVIGGTSAYFTSSETTHNIITSSGVGVEIVEGRVDEHGEVVPFENIVNALPGDTFSKIPRVINVDDGEVWVRIKVERTAKLKDDTVVDVDNELLSADYNDTNWIDGGNGYYYYKNALLKNETTEPLFTEVHIADNMSSVYKSATFNLSLTVEAVQVANNGDSVLTAEGWPEE